MDSWHAKDPGGVLDAGFAAELQNISITDATMAKVANTLKQFQQENGGDPVLGTNTWLAPWTRLMNRTF